jgi:adenosylcobyric acid synthase
MSNYTDFNVFGIASGAPVSYCSTAKDLEDAGLIIIPGTKNTMGDLAWMRKNGIEDSIKKSAAEGKPVFGICGGYQMLGARIADPFNAEGGGEIDGMGLLPVETVFETEKHMTRVSGKFLTINGIFKDLSGKKIEGYEVHMGITKPAGGSKRCNPLAFITDSVSGAESFDGAYSGSVYGSYIHGIFDAENISPLIVNALYREAGIEYNGVELSMKRHKENQYDMLANILRDSIDIDRIYKILNDGI